MTYSLPHALNSLSTESDYSLLNNIMQSAQPTLKRGERVVIIRGLLGCVSMDTFATKILEASFFKPSSTDRQTPINCYRHMLVNDLKMLYITKPQESRFAAREIGIFPELTDESIQNIWTKAFPA